MTVAAMTGMKWILILLCFQVIICGQSIATAKLLFPEYIVDPLAVQNTDNLFYITGLFVTDHGNNPWWKWFMPTFYEDHMNGANYTVAEPYSPRGVKCHIRMIGYCTPTYIHYHPGGTGHMETLGDWSRLKGLKCYYTVYMDHYQNLRFAIHCPIWTDTAEQPVYNDGIRVSPESICHAFDSNPLVSIRLFPPSKPEYWETVRKRDKGPHDVPSTSLPSLFRAHMKTEADKKALSVMIRDEERSRFPSLGCVTTPRDSTKRIVTTIQVFRNRVTGPLLTLFIEHYCRLGFRVVIFDMFGWHYSFVKDLLTAKPDLDIIYHPYTMLQLIRPDYFSYDYAASQTLDYRAFYVRDVNNQTAAIPVLNHTDLLDADKQLTFDTALLQYAHSGAILVADIDELMFTDDVKELRHLLDELFSGPNLKWENILFGRLAVGGAIPSGEVVYSTDAGKEALDRIEICLNTKFESGRDFQGMLNCFRGPLVPQRFAKFADTMRVCPFSWNHFSCMDYNRNKRGKLYWSVDKVYKAHMKSHRTWCFCSKGRLVHGRIRMLHLSHIGYMRSIFVINHKAIERENKTISFVQDSTNPLAIAYSKNFTYW